MFPRKQKSQNFNCFDFISKKLIQFLDIRTSCDEHYLLFFSNESIKNGHVREIVEKTIF